MPPRYVILGLLVILLPGCVSLQKRHSEAKKVFDSSLSPLDGLAMQQHEARFVDIPVPLEVRGHKHGYYRENGNYVAYYEYPGLDFQSISSWYQQEMERLGWQEVADSVADEIVLVFDKPKRYCMIILQNNPYKKNILTIAIHTGIKKQVLL